MISRRTALILAEVYARSFYSSYTSSSLYGGRSRKTFKVDTDKLYDFLYGCNYSAWLCNKAKTTHNYSENLSRTTRKLKEFIMKLHTGETQADATPKRTWEQRRQLGQRYLQNLAEDILNKWKNDWIQLPDYSRPKISDDIKKLRSNLELDGYVYRDSRLLTPESDVLDVEEETGVLETLYRTLRLANRETAFHHLSLSEEHYTEGRWDDSISNSRKFLECVLQEIAAAHSLQIKKASLTESTYTRPVRVREYLEREGLLETKEKETVAKVYGLLSHTGGHPYMAQNEQARLLRHLALTFSQFVMLRFQGCLV